MEEKPRRFFVGGNWKMNSSLAHCETFVKDFKAATASSSSSSSSQTKTQVVIAPPALYLSHLKSLVSSSSCFELSAQNCHSTGSGAFTGENSALAIKDLGVGWCIIGHSERRTLFHETDATVADKLAFALDPAAGLRVIVCIGETLQERESGQMEAIILTQLQALRKSLARPDAADLIVIAYEPVWAIGTGKVATPDQAQQVHAYIRSWLREKISPALASSIRIIYGGSVNGENSSDLAKRPDIDGFLVGGASLKPAEFAKICASSEGQ